MKLSKQEMLDKVNGLEIDEDIKISLMEDISDSIENEVVDMSEEVNTLKAENETLRTQNEELKTKYRERFLQGTDPSEEKEDEGMEEKEVIDIKEI